jgi:hypothetical protein
VAIVASKGRTPGPRAGREGAEVSRSRPIAERPSPLAGVLDLPLRWAGARVPGVPRRPPVWLLFERRSRPARFVRPDTGRTAPPASCRVHSSRTWSMRCPIGRSESLPPDPSRARPLPPVPPGLKGRKGTTVRALSGRPRLVRGSSGPASWGPPGAAAAPWLGGAPIWTASLPSAATTAEAPAPGATDGASVRTKPGHRAAIRRCPVPVGSPVASACSSECPSSEPTAAPSVQLGSRRGSEDAGARRAPNSTSGRRAETLNQSPLVGADRIAASQLRAGPAARIRIRSGSDVRAPTASSRGGPITGPRPADACGRPSPGTGGPAPWSGRRPPGGTSQTPAPG